MAYTASQTARNAEQDHFNAPGMCLQQCRIWAGISARYLTATKAWYGIPRSDRHYGQFPPRGAAVYWTGGSRGYGHIAISVGDGRVRSTDSGGAGRVATVPVTWVHTHWGHRYVGWSWYINGQRIRTPLAPPPKEPAPEADMPLSDADMKKIRTAIAEETHRVVASYHEEKVKDGEETIWISTGITRILATVRRIERAVTNKA